MTMLPEAVTFDFHNTIAVCDDWFRLEVYDLLPEFLTWHASVPDLAPIAVDPDIARARYREIRGEIMGHGLEQDAVSCVLTVLSDLGVKIENEIVEHGVREIMCDTLPDSRPVHGVVDGVRALHELGIRLGVVSSAAYHPFLEWSLDKFGIRGAFDAVITSASSGYYKTRTEIYTIAATALGSDPRVMVHVGDSLEFDVITASRAGMATILYDTTEEISNGNPAGSVVSSLVGIDREVVRVFVESKR